MYSKTFDPVIMAKPILSQLVIDSNEEKHLLMNDRAWGLSRMITDTDR